MKKLISQITLCLSLLVPVVCVSQIKMSQQEIEAIVRCEVSKIIIAVLRNPMIAHPYDIIKVLIRKMELLLAHGCNNPAVADLCARLKEAVQQKKQAPTILSLLQGTESLLSKEALDELNKLSKARSAELLAKFTKQILVAPRGNIDHVEGLFRC